ncbi:MAG: hypothetical protein SXQ77_05255 [Halobacteria archaeon]|nr:hypothetical protein [Halobacteria archaeon]
MSGNQNELNELMSELTELQNTFEEEAQKDRQRRREAEPMSEGEEGEQEGTGEEERESESESEREYQATSHIVVPHNRMSGSAQRPLSRRPKASPPLRSIAINPQVPTRNLNGETIPVVKKGNTYTVECTVHNLGGVAANATDVELFVEHLKPGATMDTNPNGILEKPIQVNPDVRPGTFPGSGGGVGSAGSIGNINPGMMGDLGNLGNIGDIGNLGNLSDSDGNGSNSNSNTGTGGSSGSTGSTGSSSSSTSSSSGNDWDYTGFATVPPGSSITTVTTTTSTLKWDNILGAGVVPITSDRTIDAETLGRGTAPGFGTNNTTGGQTYNQNKFYDHLYDTTGYIDDPGDYKLGSSLQKEQQHAKQLVNRLKNNAPQSTLLATVEGRFTNNVNNVKEEMLGSNVPSTQTVGQKTVTLPQTSQATARFQYTHNPPSDGVITVFYARAYSLTTSDTPNNWNALDHTTMRHVGRHEVYWDSELP